MDSASFWIKHLSLTKHPEGGWFREVYRSCEIISKKGLPARYSGFRNFSTSIYYLLESREFSAFHRIASDEIWHFYKGSPLSIYIINPSGNMMRVVLGSDPTQNQLFQFTIPKGHWFAAHNIHGIFRSPPFLRFE